MVGLIPEVIMANGELVSEYFLKSDIGIPCSSHCDIDINVILPLLNIGNIPKKVNTLFHIKISGTINQKIFLMRQ